MVSVLKRDRSGGVGGMMSSSVRGVGMWTDSGGWRFWLLLIVEHKDVRRDALEDDHQGNDDHEPILVGRLEKGNKNV